jgi:thiamine biosynthesis lipoprotein ApbE
MGRLARASFAALGTNATIVSADRRVLPYAEELLRDELAAVDEACSRFRADSELTAVNTAAGRPVRVGALLLAAVDAALWAAEATDGLVDPTVGRSLVGLGYDRDFASLGVGWGRARVRIAPAGGWRCVRVDRAAATLELPAGVALDLGATGKAFAADRAVRVIAEATATGTLVSIGGDIATAGEAPRNGWPIRVTDDHRALAGVGQTISVGSGGLATSSTTVRRWRAGGAVRHHIVDPRSGLPAADVWRTVSVAAATCLDANAASTAALVQGQDAPGWLERAGLDARLVAPDGRVRTTGGWPQEDAR